MLITGLFLGVLAYFSKVDEIWMSIGVAFVVCSIVRLVRYARMRKNPEYRERVEIAQKDERNIKIAEKSAALTFRTSLFILCVAELVLFAMNMADIAVCIGIVVCLLLFSYWISYLMYSREL